MILSVNNFLITGISPTNNEKNVAINTTITISFSTDMDVATLNSGTLVLRKVNGDIITCTIEYVNLHRKAIITPSVSLESGTQYQLQVAGGEDGIQSITGEYLSESRYYEFTTNYEVLLSPPTSVSVSVSSGFPTVSWSQPDQYDPALALSYEVMISSSSLSTDPPIWPSTGDVNTTGNTTLSVPKQFSDDNYYAYVRAKNDTGVSDWGSYQFSITTESPVEVSTSLFEAIEVYPKVDSVDITPEQIIVVLSDNVDESSVTSDTFYVVAKAKKGSLTTIDFLTEFSPSKQIAAVIDPIVSPTNIITLTPESGVIVNDAEYTVVLRESIQSASLETLGEAYAWSFMSKFSILYGDVEVIRDNVTSAFVELTDKTLYKYISDISRYAYNVVSRRSDFNASDYEGGKAPYYVHQYVELQATYDLIINAHMRASSGSGSSVRLGDLSVEKNSESEDITAMLRNLKDRIKPWEDLLHGHHNRGYAKPVSVVKGEAGAAYPDFLTRAEYRELGQ